MNSYGFRERAAAGRQHELAEAALSQEWPDIFEFRWEREGNDMDRRGVDLQVTRYDGHAHTVEIKYNDWPHGHDIRVEWWSVEEQQRLGWSVDPDKLTEWLLNLWPDGFHSLLPFAPFREIVSRNREQYRRDYGERRTSTEGRYHTVFTPVPVDRLRRDMTTRVVA